MLSLLHGQKRGSRVEGRKILFQGCRRRVGGEFLDAKPCVIYRCTNPQKEQNLVKVRPIWNCMNKITNNGGTCFVMLFSICRITIGRCHSVHFFLLHLVHLCCSSFVRGKCSRLSLPSVNKSSTFYMFTNAAALKPLVS